MSHKNSADGNENGSRKRPGLGGESNLKTQGAKDNCERYEDYGYRNPRH